ncbi:MAG: hypothetical protein PHP28_10100 [Actinomycetota bacterium]|nr:hypothetical protein [Actinomycetota bacterium]MDD5667457.1 hypothetical protein [Actinomycetota bacterium]
MKTLRSRLAVCALVLLLAAGTLVAFPGCGGGLPGVEEVWEKSLEAEKGINSLHMEISISYENTNFGGGQIQTTSINVSGENVQASSSLFGQSFSEIIVVNGKQYSRTMGSEEWTEQTATVDRQSLTQMQGFANLPSEASSSENLGLETLGGSDAYHLSFALTPDEVKSLFKNVQASQLTSNAGGEVDVWVEEETSFRLKYEALIRNANITEQIGFGDIRVTATITSINEPISIAPPV